MPEHDLRPHVLIVGGFLTEPLQYRPLRARLLGGGAASVAIAPVHVADWLAAGLVGLGPLGARTGRAVRAAWREAGSEPLIVVGHSGGGILARLAMSPVAFDGRRVAVAPAVGCLVTLGTPHDLAAAPVRLRHRGIEAARFLAETTPGAWFAPATAYLTVASDLVRPARQPRPAGWDRLRGGLFRAIVGPLEAAGSDGIVSASMAHLAGARQMTLPDVRHGVLGGPWYGDAAVVARWWPVAVELWRGARAVREQRRHPTRAAGSDPGHQPSQERASEIG